jgi:GxxExxY protein
MNLSAESTKVHTKGTKELTIENEVSYKIIGCAMKVHSALGPGLLESAYEECLAYELRRMNIKVDCQVALPLVYEEVKLEAGYRVDLLVENKVIIECKAVETLHPVFAAQLQTYLKLSGCRLGLLINFHELHLKDGIKRCINTL